MKRPLPAPRDARGLRPLAALSLALGLLFGSSAFAAAPAGKAPAAPKGPAVEEHMLANGMRVLLVPRRLSPTVSCGWVARVGSANERPGITGIAHLFEHMMFKGTHVIGTRDYALDAKLIAEQEAVMDEMRAEISKLREAYRRGDLDDITKPEAKTPRMKALEAQFDSLVAAQRKNMIKNEFDLVLQKNGASRINAFTNEDMTFYFYTLPANKLELYFWMEADRLKNRVFREFYSERDVVYEERRRSVESTPTGKFDESFNSTFWDASPYSWDTIGWPSDVANITLAQANEFYDRFYAPQNLTAVLVGDFDTKQALALAEQYLGSIPRGQNAIPEMITTEPQQLGEKRFYGEAETNPSVEIRWHAVPSVHKDVPALTVLQTVLNGDTGRLRKQLVLGDGPATRASARLDDRKYEGLFAIEGECKEGKSPDEVERAVYTQLDRIAKDGVPEDELQAAKNRFLTTTYRQLDGNFFLMLRYGVADARGDWKLADRLSDDVQKVSAADLQRVTKKYFTRENRAVATYTRKAGSEPEDPVIAALPPEAKGMVKQALGRVAQAKDAAQLQQMLQRMEAMGAQVPENMKPGLDYVKAKIQARLAELDAAKK
ncbi:MAG: insulinase family protein [Candidatus Eisenbacteria bacterium]|nr:insulinase family protein [Candidatus Eisenbacteria bacterium]